MYDEFDDGSGGNSSLARKIALGVGVVAVVALGWFVVTNLAGGDGDGDEVAGGSSTTVVERSAEQSATSTPEDGTEVTTGDDESTTTTDRDTSTTRASTTTEGTTTEAPTTTAAPVAPTTAAAPAAPAYATNPDGSPAWVVAIFDTDSITGTGAVPDQAAKDRLRALAVANAKPGQDATVNMDNVTINPAVPASVGVRVVELTSARFPDGSAVVSPEQAVELDRVANIMTALPNITALIIGHADQRGGEVSNYVLSADRAEAVLQYLVSKGVDPSRLSSRAVGESDLLSLNDDAAALALNKRTEFVFNGLLLPG